MLDFVILDIVSFSVGIVYDHEITKHMHYVILLCFLKNGFVSFSFSKYAVFI